MQNSRLDRLTDYPFARLAALLADIAPDAAAGDPIIMSIGEPQHAPPAIISRVLAENSVDWNRYPPTAGTPDLRRAVADWLRRRFALPPGMIGEEGFILPVSGTREALYLLAQAVCPTDGPPPAVLMPNPFYQVYYGAAVMAGAEPVLLPATAETKFQPDLNAIPADLLDRAALVYLCSPGNPQGQAAGMEMLKQAVLLARKHDFVLAMDECYSELYDQTPPPGALQACAELGGDLSNVVVFHSLSKRSSAAGLRSGFVAGDPRVIGLFQRLRSYGGAVPPMPIMAVSAALWRDEAHVEENRAAYRAKIDAAEQIFGNRFGFYRPQGGFFLWLNVGNGEAATRRLWQNAAVKVLPGAYLAQTGADGVNPGQCYIRVALVHDLPKTVQALRRMAQVL